MLELATKQILIVEDDPDIGALLGETLTEAGYSVVYCRSAIEGLRLLNSSPGPVFQLITLDLNLPGMSGNEFLQELACQTPDACQVPVIVVSANPANLIYSAQVKAVVSKPFDLDYLLTTIQQAA